MSCVAGEGEGFAEVALVVGDAVGAGGEGGAVDVAGDGCVLVVALGR